MHGLKARKFKAADQMIGSISCRLEMEDMLEHPAGLSSGQKQRVALVRAVVRNPPVPLFDEPSRPPLCVGAAAGVTRTQGPATRIRLHHHRRHTRPGRGLSLATPLAFMDAGVVQQFGTPDEVFDDPANLFVAQFVGESKINALRGTARVADGRVRVEIGSISGGLYTMSPTWPTAPGSPWASGRRCGIASDSAKGITTTWPISSTARVRLGDQHGRQAWRTASWC